jgi:hypothetical protein
MHQLVRIFCDRYCGLLKSSRNSQGPDEVLPPDLDDVEVDVDSQNKKGSGLVVMFSNMGLCTMRTCHNISIDGTFSTAPAPFRQIVFLQASQAGKRAVPVVFALLTHKVNKYHTGTRVPTSPLLTQL